ncbi:signal peptidase I [Cellulomonas hominis]
MSAASPVGSSPDEVGPEPVGSRPVDGATARRRRGGARRRGPLAVVRLGLSGGLLALTVLVAVVAVVVPALTGAHTYTVLTRSMEPGLPPGTFLIVRPTPVEDLRVGDIITFQLESGKPAVVTHRVIAVELTSDGERRFRTQGDNNALADADPVRPVQIRGELWYAIPFLGWVAGARSEGAAGVWIPVLAGLVLCYAAVMVGGWVLERRRARTAARSRRPSGRP